MYFQQVSPNGQEMSPQPGFLELASAAAMNDFNRRAHHLILRDPFGAFQVAVAHQDELLTIDGIDNEQEAACLVNHEIYALKRDYRLESEDLEADGYPLDYFIGFDLHDSDGNRVGKIVEVDEQTENAIFIVEDNDKEFMLPATDDLILEFDLDKEVIVMELPEGILDLNQ